MNDCVFCNIITGKQKTNLVFEDENLIAIHDIHPVTPVHVLIIPRQHIPSVNELDDENAELISGMILVAQKIAWRMGLKETGYRLVLNTGRDAGQSVDHLHMHLIGGRKMPFRFE